MDEEASLDELYTSKLLLADRLLASIADIRKIDGLEKLHNKIVKEKSFLSQVKVTGKAKKEHFFTTNLIHYEAVVSTLLADEECDSVLKTFSYDEGSESKKIVVDIVSKRGMKWTKVIARSPKSLTVNSIGGNKFGQRTLLDQAADFQACANVNPAFFTTPQIIFKFTCGVQKVLGDQLLSMGIKVSGASVEDSVTGVCYEVEQIPVEIEECSGQLDSQVCTTNIRKLNLDITSMIALVSEMTNAECHHTFQLSALNQQSTAEKTVKVKLTLENLFQGKELFCCETAANGFLNIVNTVGGEKEKERSHKLLARVTVVKDSLSRRVIQGLRLGGKIKERSRIIFGTGDAIEAMTVSANYGFLRSASKQGVQLVAFIHEPRALSENAQTLEETSQTCLVTKYLYSVIIYIIVLFVANSL